MSSIARFSSPCPRKADGDNQIHKVLARTYAPGCETWKHTMKLSLTLWHICNRSYQEGCRFFELLNILFMSATNISIQQHRTIHEKNRYKIRVKKKGKTKYDKKIK
jgi:hypothetical protein